MQNLLVDTNVILRFLIGDSPAQAEYASALFRRADVGELTLEILPEVLAECVFVLESVYTFSREDIAQTLQQLLEAPSVHMHEKHRVIAALSIYRSSSLHYVDCVLITHAQAAGTTLETFDTRLLKQSKRN